MKKNGKSLKGQVETSGMGSVIVRYVRDGLLAEWKQLKDS